MRPCPSSRPPSLHRVVLLVLCSLAASVALLGGSVAAAAESGPRWRDLNAEQRTVLKPLERDWSSIDATRKQKWLDIAGRYPKLPPDEQGRISERMNSWAKMTPAERGQARLNFQESRELTRQERQARWEAYQALTPEQKREFATRNAPPAATKRSGEVPRRAPAAGETAQGKSNIVPNPAYAAPRKAVAPTVVQAQPGATTTLINKRPVPPSHQQPGLPKIAATPGFVDKQTLLPQRGAQAAATRSAAASDARANPAR
jgi:hypothetical protein